MKNTKHFKEINHFLPEARYRPTYLLKDPSKSISEIVHVKPLEFFSSEDILTVEGVNFRGIIPKDELSIYPMTYFEGNSTPKLLWNAFHTHIALTAEITSYDESNGLAILSRKKSMERALSSGIFAVENKMKAKIIYSYKNKTFVDLGAGVTGIVPTKEFSMGFISDIEEFLKGKDYIPVKIIGNKGNWIMASHKDFFEPKKIIEGDIVQGKILDYIPDGTGVFVEISPTQIGILDTEYLTVVKSEYLDVFDNTIVKGKIYSFRVHRIRSPKNTGSNRLRYCLRLV